MKFPYKASAIKVEHPLGAFFVAGIPARVLLKVMQVDRFKRYVEQGEREIYSVAGAQRREIKSRKKLISEFVKSEEAVFPNSVIIAANDISELKPNTTGNVVSFDELDSIDGGGISYELDDQPLEYINSIRWKIETLNFGDRTFYELVIPTDAKIAFIVDGQHRLYGFWELQKELEQGILYEDKELSEERLDTLIPCSIFFDLPKVYQAYIFATINFNQRPVDKSLAYELFAFNLEGDPISWPPDKLAVFISRKLNSTLDNDIMNYNSDNNTVLNPAPFNKKIKNAGSEEANQDTEGNNWKISMATMVNGILPLISKKPQIDRSRLYRNGKDQPRTILANDRTVLRELYLEHYDQDIYSIISRFFSVFELYLLRKQTGNSYFRKTVGIIAGFSLLKAVLEVDFWINKNIKIEYFLERLEGLNNIEPTAGESLGQASGAGKTVLMNLMLVAVDSANNKNYSKLFRGDNELKAYLTQHLREYKFDAIEQ